MAYQTVPVPKGLTSQAFHRTPAFRPVKMPAPGRREEATDGERKGQPRDHAGPAREGTGPARGPGGARRQEGPTHRGARRLDVSRAPESHSGPSLGRDPRG